MLRTPTQYCGLVHDKTKVYANERRWVPKTETEVPKPNSEGASLTVADFVSVDYGWLRSPDWKEPAGRSLPVSSFALERNLTAISQTATYWLKSLTVAMDIIQTHSPHDDHFFVFDNATTHLKRADTALTARKMPLKTSKPEKNWLVGTSSLDELGKQLYEADGGS